MSIQFMRSVFIFGINSQITEVIKEIKLEGGDLSLSGRQISVKKLKFQMMNLYHCNIKLWPNLSNPTKVLLIVRQLKVK